MSEATGETKKCKDCKQRLPVEQFWMADTKKGRRQPICKDCHNGRRRKKREKKWRDNATKLAARINRSVFHYGYDVDKFEKVLDEAARQFGGFDALLEAFMDHFHYARENKPGSPELASCYRAILNLGIVWSQEKDRQDAEVRARLLELPGAELEAEADAELARRMTDLFMRDPGLAVESLRALGYTVEPPSEGLFQG